MSVKPHSLTEDVQLLPANGDSPTPGEWSIWLRAIERKRRLLARLWPNGWRLSITLLLRLTTISFRMDGVAVTESQAVESLAAAPARRPFRSRLSQRLRNHMAILRHIQRLLSTGQALTISTVVRWYASLSCGLCNSALTTATMDRLSAVVSRISSPRLRHQPAVLDIVGLHAQLMADPLVPSFNGILTRLLLCYHLGRCGFPPVLFDPTADRAMLPEERRLLPRMMELIDASYSMLLRGV
jgi:hypothetical protein